MSISNQWAPWSREWLTYKVALRIHSDFLGASYKFARNGNGWIARFWTRRAAQACADRLNAVPTASTKSMQWTSNDDAAAAAEGWIVSRTSDGFDEIQRVDDPQVFASDAEAVAHVYWMAGTDSKLHRQALAYTLRNGNAWPYKRERAL